MAFERFRRWIPYRKGKNDSFVGGDDIALPHSIERPKSLQPQYSVPIHISTPPKDGVALSWHAVTAIWRPTNKHHLVLQTFAQDTLKIDIVKLLEHTPQHKLIISLYWKNTSPKARKYTYCMHFRIATELSCAVVFGNSFSNNLGTPFDGELIQLGQGELKPSLIKSRTDSIKSFFSKRSSSWDSIISGITIFRQRETFGLAPQRINSAKNLSRNARTLEENNPTPENNSYNSLEYSTTRDDFVVSCTEVTSNGAENDKWILLDLKRDSETQKSREDRISYAAEGATITSLLTHEDRKRTGGQAQKTTHDDQIHSNPNISSSLSHSASLSNISRHGNLPKMDGKLSSPSNPQIGSELLSYDFTETIDLPKNDSHAFESKSNHNSSLKLSERHRVSPKQSFHAPSRISSQVNQLSDQKNTISEPMRRFLEPDQTNSTQDEPPKNLRDSSEHSSEKIQSCQKEETKPTSGNIELLTPKKIPQPSMTPASDDYWTWDGQLNAYFHVDSDTQSVVWYEDSEVEDGREA